MSHKRLTKHFTGDFLSFCSRVNHMNAAFESILESALASAAGVNLGFDHQAGSAKFCGDLASFLSCLCDFAGRCGDTVFCEEFFGLIFVDVHGGKWGGETVGVRAEASRRQSEDVAKHQTLSPDFVPVKAL